MFRDVSALFLDRDGTLIEDCGYLSDPEKVKLLPGVRDCLRELQARHWLFFLFSNQSGVGRGFFTLEQVEACNRKMLALLDLGEPFFSRVCLATSTPDQPCAYRKPSPKFILECLQDFNLKPNRCWMVGDKVSDIQAGEAAHIHTILLGTTSSYGEELCCVDFYAVLKCLVSKA